MTGRSVMCRDVHPPVPPSGKQIKDCGSLLGKLVPQGRAMMRQGLQNISQTSLARRCKSKTITQAKKKDIGVTVVVRHDTMPEQSDIKSPDRPKTLVEKADRYP